MRLDYSEKMGAVRESAERKPIQKNRPRKEPIGVFALLSLLVLLVCTFGAGVLTGWFLFKGGEDAPAASAPVPQVREEQIPPQGQPGAVPQDTPLTFYNTLPSGGQAVIGSGLNPKIAPAAPTQPTPEPVAASAAKPADSKEGETRYLVQIASYRDKKEAEGAQARLSAKGVAAYLVESKVQDKGVWYRLRVGRHLSKAEAGQLAGKVGSGATVLPE